MSEPVRVLVVDDEASVGHIFHAALTDFGWRVETALCGKEAIEHIDRGGYAIYLIDKNLSDTSGIELVRRIREKDGTAVCVLITAFPSLDSAKETLRLAVDDYLVKPFENLSAICDRLRQLLAKKGMHVQPVVDIDEEEVNKQKLSVVIGSPDADSLAWLHERFERRGDEVECLSSSSEVAAKVCEKKPDLLMVDTALVEPDVPTLLQQVDVPAIVLITPKRPTARLVIGYINLSIRAVLEKPIDEAQFSKELDGLLGRLRARRLARQSI